jgi:hypothetical protein
MCGADAVNAAVHAFPVWRDTPPVERALVLSLPTVGGGKLRSYLPDDHAGARQDVRRTARDGVSRHREHRIRLGVHFYTRQKVVSTRWFGEELGDVWKK